jgi:hypothetical protein
MLLTNLIKLILDSQLGRLLIYIAIISLRKKRFLLLR